MVNLATTNDSQLATANVSDFKIPRGYICTLDITTIEGKMSLATALNGAVSLRDKVGETLRVTNFVTTQGVRARTGEECINTYLICDDGTVYFSQSDGIARSVKVLVGLFIDASTETFMNPVELGVGVMVKEQTLQNGNTLKTAVPVKLS